MTLSTSRRALLSGLAVGAFASPAISADRSPPMLDLIRSPLLKGLYSGLSHRIDDKGHSGSNIGRPWIVEEQRWGTEWILRGIASDRPGWIQQGWRALDVGVQWQESDGGFGRLGSFHSASLFIEGLARACLIDPTGATSQRLASIKVGCEWLMQPKIEAVGTAENAPYTHRCYILAAALGEGAKLTGSVESRRRALHWARQGIAQQLPNGVNPEREGHDASYQMVGVLHALRYLPTCDDRGTVLALKKMMKRAVAWELGLLDAKGDIDPAGSTRVGHERSGAGFKQVNYPEAFQALVFGSISVDPSWAKAAKLIGKPRGWL